jgi:hypothetical protein
MLLKKILIHGQGEVKAALGSLKSGGFLAIRKYHGSGIL